MYAYVYMEKMGRRREGGGGGTWIILARKKGGSGELGNVGWNEESLGLGWG